MQQVAALNVKEMLYKQSFYYVQYTCICMKWENRSSGLCLRIIFFVS